jgi:hypothetical protein
MISVATLFTLRLINYNRYHTFFPELLVHGISLPLFHLLWVNRVLNLEANSSAHH